jgi:hypothetical protein
VSQFLRQYDLGRQGNNNFFFQTLLDSTDVCPLLTKQYIQVGLQIHTIHVIQFLNGLSPHTWYG